jgi:N-acylneuraminate cytidylyltransferase
MNAVAFIFARGGSKGLPGKNIQMLVGKPLIAWAIECALKVPRISRVIVSTDSNEIAAIAAEYGAEVPFIRPAYLATDKSPEWLAWRHGIEYLRDSFGEMPEVIVSLPATAPLRMPADIDNCLDEYEKGSSDVVITVTDAHRNPYFNMVKIDSDGTCSLVLNPPEAIERRQDVPLVYDMTTTCYVVKTEFVMSHNSIFEGKVRAVHIPIERAIDIDTKLDFRIAQTLFESTDLKS